MTDIVHSVCVFFFKVEFSNYFKFSFRLCNGFSFFKNGFRFGFQAHLPK